MNSVAQTSQANFQLSTTAVPRRWVVAGLLFLASILNYIDRGMLGLFAPTLQRQLHITDNQYSWVINAFLIAYTASYLLSGFITDRIGPRITMACMVGFWSIANALTGLARSMISLTLFRGMLGIAEASGPTAAKIVSEQFPPGERALAIGLYSAGSSVGATLAPFLCIYIAGEYGWRGAFVATGVAGLLWLLPWLTLYRNPAASPRGASPASHPAARDNPAAARGGLALWKIILCQPAVLYLMLSRVLTDGVWVFFVFWFSKYLHSVRAVDEAGLRVTWVVFVASDLGFICGGFLSDTLIKRGVPQRRARIYVLLGCALLSTLSPLVALVSSLTLSLALTMVVVFAVTAWFGNVSALMIDIIPQQFLGTTYGVVAAGSGVGGILMNSLLAYLIAHYSYTHCFYAMGVALPSALLLLWRFRKDAAPAPDAP